MKILGIALIAILIIALYSFFSYSARVARETVTIPQATSTAAPPVKPALPEIQPTTTPQAGFHGPTIEPTMRGPTGPPPNY